MATIEIDEAMLTKWKAICDSATPGPFIAEKDGEDDPERWVVLQEVDPRRHYFIAEIQNGAPGDTLKTEESNAALFALSRTAMPDLIEALREAREQIRLMWEAANPMVERLRNGLRIERSMYVKPRNTVQPLLQVEPVEKFIIAFEELTP